MSTNAKTPRKRCNMFIYTTCLYSARRHPAPTISSTRCLGMVQVIRVAALLAAAAEVKIPVLPVGSPMRAPGPPTATVVTG